MDDSIGSNQLSWEAGMGYPCLFVTNNDYLQNCSIVFRWQPITLCKSTTSYVLHVDFLIYCLDALSKESANLTIKSQNSKLESKAKLLSTFISEKPHHPFRSLIHPHNSPPPSPYLSLCLIYSILTTQNPHPTSKTQPSAPSTFTSHSHSHAFLGSTIILTCTIHYPYPQTASHKLI